jgi:hypothetical protein
MASYVRLRVLGMWMSSVAMKPDEVRDGEGTPAARASASLWSRMALAFNLFTS